MLVIATLIQGLNIIEFHIESFHQRATYLLLLYSQRNQLLDICLIHHYFVLIFSLAKYFYAVYLIYLMT